MLREVPEGLLPMQYPKTLSPQHVELRSTLESAVEQADLNVTERMALNQKFFPKGEGFKLFPKDKCTAVINLFRTSRPTKQDDIFMHEVDTLKIPEHISILQEKISKSSKGSFQTNLDNALKKLKTVMKDVI